MSVSAPLLWHLGVLGVRVLGYPVAMRGSRSLFAFVCLALFFAGCGDDGAPLQPDSGTPDAGRPDAGAPDAGAPDGGTPPDRFPAATAGTIYSYATGCYSIGVVGTSKYLAASGGGDGFEVSATTLDAASRFRMRPADLGTYLLYDEAKRYLVSLDDAGLQRRPELLSDTTVSDAGVTTIDDSFQSEGEWDLVVSTDDPSRFRLRHHRSGGYLSAEGTLVGISDAAEILFFEQSDCATFPELTVDAEGTVTPKTFDDGSLFGFVDMHEHMFSNFAFGGGGIFHGAPFHRLGVEHALPDCEPFHGVHGEKDLLGFAFGNLGGLTTMDLLSLLLTLKSPVPHDTSGYPDFKSWPDAVRSPTHQMMYYKWVERAYMSGLRLLVQHATTNHVLCELLVGLGTQPQRYSCNDMVAVDRIVEETKALERYVDALHGGRGKGWFRIVTSPAQAREVIADGKLAVVLGIETSVLFDCFLNPPEGYSRCTEADVVAKLDEYYAKGLRALFPVHKFDNGFSAGDGHRGIMDLGNMIQSGDWSNYRLCADLGVADVPRNFDGGDVPFGGLNMPRAQYDAPPPNDFAGFMANPINVLVTGIDGVSTINDVVEILSAPPLTGDYCQSAGLTSLGEFLMAEMMKRGMLIEVDHMPRLSRRRAMEILEANDYPAVGSHGNNYNGEMYALGGVSDSGFGRCASASTPATMDDNYQRRVQLARDEGAFPAEGFGFDLNGFAGAPGPRFGDRAHCSDPQSHPITYPFKSYAGDVTFTQPTVGNRTIDFNTEGLVHIGLVAEYIEDVRRDGVTDEELEPLFKSAEGYIRMWEKAEARGAAIREE